MPAAAAKSVAIVTKSELIKLADWEKQYAKLTKKLADAKREVEQRRQQLAEKVLGITTSEELKELSPAAVEKKQARRAELGEWKPGPGAPEFSFVKTNEGRYPAWAKLYAEKLGESAAAKVKAETDPIYSYRVDVEVPA